MLHVSHGLDSLRTLIPLSFHYGPRRRAAVKMFTTPTALIIAAFGLGSALLLSIYSKNIFWFVGFILFFAVLALVIHVQTFLLTRTCNEAMMRLWIKHNRDKLRAIGLTDEQIDNESAYMSGFIERTIKLDKLYQE